MLSTVARPNVADICDEIHVGKIIKGAIILYMSTRNDRME